jgi:hypothetical protein
MNARLLYHGDEFFLRKVASVNALVSFQQKNGPPLCSLAISVLPNAVSFLLRWRHMPPPLLAFVCAAFPSRVAFPAFVSQAKQARGIFQEVLFRSRQLLFTTVANSETVLGAAIFSHAQNVGSKSPFFNLKK